MFDSVAEEHFPLLLSTSPLTSSGDTSGLMNSTRIIIVASNLKFRDQETLKGMSDSGTGVAACIT